MNYHVYYDNREFRYSFNYIETVGDLQTIIIQNLNIPKDKVLLILQDRNILGVDFPFEDTIIQHNLYETHLYVVSDPNRVGTGTKLVYNEWLNTQIRGRSLMESHRNILYQQTHNSHIAGNLTFFTQGGPVSPPTRNTTNNNNNRRQDPRRTTTRQNQRTNTTTSGGAGLFQQLINAIGSDNGNSFIQEFMNQNDLSDLGITVSAIPLNLSATLPSSDSGLLNFILNHANLTSVPITLTREGLSQLPVFRFRELPAEIRTNTECSICRETYNNSDEVRMLLCRHFFHKDCIDRWLSEENVRCPLCRHDNRDAPTSGPTGAEEPEEDQEPTRQRQRSSSIERSEADSDSSSE